MAELVKNLFDLMAFVFLLSSGVLLLRQSVLCLKSEVEPLDFFPGSVLLLTGIIFASIQRGNMEWWQPVSLVLLVGAGVLMRPFHVPIDEITEEYEESSSGNSNSKE